MSPDLSPTMFSNLIYCGIVLSTVAYCLVLLVACRSKTWRQSELNWCWLLATGFYLLDYIADEFSYNDIMEISVEYFSLASISWMLAGGFVAVKKARESEAKVMLKAALFGMLAPVPLILVLLLTYFLPFDDIIYLVCLHIQVGITILVSVCLYAHSIWYIVRNAGNDLSKSITFLLFSLFAFCCWLLGTTAGTLLYDEYENAPENAFNFQLNLYIISSLGVFVFSIIHIFFIKDNRSYVTCNKSVTSMTPETVDLHTLK